MRYVKSLLALGSCLVLAFSSACGIGSAAKDSGSEASYAPFTTAPASLELSDRQKEILLSRDIEPDYEKLTPGQKADIIATEELMVYGEQKYGFTLHYLNFSSSLADHTDSVVVYASGQLTDADSFTITRTWVDDAWVYSDNYDNIRARDAFTQYLTDGVAECCPEASFTVVSTLSHVEGFETMQQPSDFDGNTVCFTVVAIRPKGMSTETYTRLVQDFNDWTEQRKLYGQYQLILLREEVTQEINLVNYTDCFQSENYTERETFFVAQPT